MVLYQRVYWLRAPRVNKIRTCPHICYGFWAAGVSQIGTRCPTVWPQIAFQNQSHHISESFLCWVSILMNPMKTSACEGWFSALNGEKTNLLQEFFSPSNWLSLQSPEPASNSMIHLHILSAFWTLCSIFWRKHCWWWWGECGQEKDKAATSQTLKLCRKRKGGKVGFLHLRH